MDYKIILSNEALADLENIVTYVARHDPEAAERLGNRLLDTAESLQILPHRGRVVPEFRNREWREVIFGSYRIIYRIKEGSGTVEVSRFWHGARGFPIIPVL